MIFLWLRLIPHSTFHIPRLSLLDYYFNILAMLTNMVAMEAMEVPMPNH